MCGFKIKTVVCNYLKSIDNAFSKVNFFKKVEKPFDLRLLNLKNHHGCSCYNKQCSNSRFNGQCFSQKQNG